MQENDLNVIAGNRRMVIVMTNIIRQADIITRKDHKCWGCTFLFPKGSFMFTLISVDMGKISTCYYCPKCSSYMNDHPYDFEDGIEYGDLLNDEEYKKLLFTDDGRDRRGDPPLP